MDALPDVRELEFTGHRRFPRRYPAQASGPS
jgi:hypothetical protein